MAELSPSSKGTKETLRPRIAERSGLHDVAGRSHVVGPLDLDAAIEVDGARAEAVLAEGLRRQRQEVRVLLGKHRDLPLGGAVDARVAPALVPLRYAWASSSESKRIRFSGVFWVWPMPDSTFPMRLVWRTRHGSATTP